MSSTKLKPRLIKTTRVKAKLLTKLVLSGYNCTPKFHLNTIIHVYSSFAEYLCQTSDIEDTFFFSTVKCQVREHKKVSEEFSLIPVIK